jgi:hypothetical protein
VLIGSGGNDTIFGGPGDDLLIGGPGIDCLVPGSGNNIVVQAPLSCFGGPDPVITPAAQTDGVGRARTRWTVAAGNWIRDAVNDEAQPSRAVAKSKTEEDLAQREPAG